jgi:hypothetical protein
MQTGAFNVKISRSITGSQVQSGEFQPKFKVSANLQACCLLHAGQLLGLFLYHDDGGNIPPKQLIFAELHDVISHNIELLLKN